MQSFTSTISHEFRTPLATSLMFIEQILEYTLEDSIRKVLVLINMQLNMLLCLVNDILDIKMINQGVYAPKIEKFNPNDIFRFIVQMFKPQSQI